MVGYQATDAEPPPVDRLKYFGIWLREEREAAGMSQRALAREAGLSPQAVSRIERGETQTPRWETIRRLAAALGIAPERLIQWTWRPLAVGAPKSRWSATRNARRYLREQLLRGGNRSGR
jgi:transcriptional regulator with XRE-family HTH domain